MNYAALNDRELINRTITSTDPLVLELAKRLEWYAHSYSRDTWNQIHKEQSEDHGQLRLFP